VSRPVQSAPEEPPEIVATRAEAEGLATPPLIVREALEAELGLGPLEVERASAGHSNVTFFLDAGVRRLVLRRPPRGPFPASAHDVLREYRILAALGRYGVRAPKVVLSCADPEVIGAPFYVMERVDGVVADAATPSPLDNPTDRRRIGDELIDTLLELHRVDWRGSNELSRIGRADGYLTRQVKLWASQWRRQRTREIEVVERVGERLRWSIPESPPATLVHGDYKLDNVALAPLSPARIVAVLDWEMATIGDPLADLGFLTATWLQGDDPERLLGLSRAAAEPGYPTRSELIERYATASGLAVERLSWYQALALWKLAILLEGSYRRFKAGTTDDPFFARLERGVPSLAEQAAEALDGGFL
jgi:aminoglycoside phosphotransferase (APT) family kinase protein